MELSKPQERRLVFLAHLLSLDPGDATDRKRALRYLNQSEGCFHGFQYSHGSLELFVFIDEASSLESVLHHLPADLKSLQAAILRTSDPANPFFLSIRENAEPWKVLDPDSAEAEDDSDAQPAHRPYMETLDVTVLRTRASKDLTDYEIERSIRDLRRRLARWKEEIHADIDIFVEQDELGRDDFKSDDRLKLPLQNAPLHTKSAHGELFVGFTPLQEIYRYHVQLGKRHKSKHNMVIVSSNIRNYLGSATHTNSSLIDAFQAMETAGNCDDFPFLHNGMTLTGDDLKVQQRDGAWYLLIDRPKIINGAQSLFTYEQYVKKSVHPVEPQVLVKVVVPYAGAGSFVRQVTMANNRQNPVFSHHLRAADDLQFYIWQKLQEEGFTYVYKDGVRLKARTRKLELRMRPELSRTLLMLDARLGESRASDCVFDQETLYQRCFGAFLRQPANREQDFVRLAIVYTKAWQLLGRLPLKIRTVVPGKGTRIEANEDNPLTRITWNGRLEDKFSFRSAVRDVAIALTLRHWLRFGNPLADFTKLVQNELEFNESVVRYAQKTCSETLKQVLIAEYKDNKAFFDTIDVIDNDTGETVERRLWKGFGANAVYAELLDKLAKRDSAWARCKGGLDDIW